MICKNCKDAGDVSRGSQPLSEMLHAKCNYPDCYCQHRTGSYIQA